MDKISGLILDVYDDRQGQVLRGLFPDPGALPALVKTAHHVTEEERQALPDDAFALVLVNHGEELKKYATIDAGNTALSVEYFLKTGHKLPVEAQKVAAVNLLAACEWHGLEAPEMLKKASVEGKVTKILKSTAATRKKLKTIGSPASKPKAESPQMKRLREFEESTDKLLGKDGSALEQFLTEDVIEKDAGLARVRRLAKSLGNRPPEDALSDPRMAAMGSATLKNFRRVSKKNVNQSKYEKTRGFKAHVKDLEGYAKKKQSSFDPKVGEHGFDRAGVKLALNLQKMKANLDKAPDRASKFPLKKEAMGALGLATTGLGALELVQQAPRVKKNLQAIRGTSRVMTPQQIAQRAGTGV